MTPRRYAALPKRISAYSILLAAMLVGCDRDSFRGTSASPGTSASAIVARLTDDPEQTRGTPGVLLLGSVRGGDSIRRTLYLQNTSAVAQKVDRWTSSCDCLELGEVPLVVPPRGQRDISLSIGGESLLDFRGALAIEIAGYDGDRRVVSFEL